MPNFIKFYVKLQRQTSTYCKRSRQRQVKRQIWRYVMTLRHIWRNITRWRSDHWFVSYTWGKDRVPILSPTVVKVNDQLKKKRKSRKNKVAAIEAHSLARVGVYPVVVLTIENLPF